MIENLIDAAWCQMIGTSGIHKTLGITRGHVKVLRYQTRQGVFISLDKKLKLLNRAGWNPGAKQWEDSDMIAFLRFYIKQPGAAKEFSPAYILEKFKHQGK